MLTFTNGKIVSLLQPCFSVIKMYIQCLNNQVFPMKTSEAFQIWIKCVENKWEGNQVPLFAVSKRYNLEILPYDLHCSDVMSFTKIIKDVDG